MLRIKCLETLSKLNDLVVQVHKQAEYVGQRLDIIDTAGNYRSHATSEMLDAALPLVPKFKTRTRVDDIEKIVDALDHARGELARVVKALNDLQSNPRNTKGGL